VTKTTVEKDMAALKRASMRPRETSSGSRPPKSYPGQPRFECINTLVRIINRTEYVDQCTLDTRLHIFSAPLDIEPLAAGARGHWGVESMHWLLDVEFKDELSRYRSGHGAKNMAVVRRFSLGLLRANKTKGSVKTRRKLVRWNTDFLLNILQLKWALTWNPCRVATATSQALRGIARQAR
jgi:hypothetical protein